MQDESFRIGITSLDCEKANMIPLELEFDKETFSKSFKFIEHETF